MSECLQTPNNYEPPLAAAATGNEIGSKAAAAAIVTILTPFSGLVQGIEIKDQPQRPMIEQLEQENIPQEEDIEAEPEPEPDPEEEEELDDQEEELEEEGEQE